MVIFGQEKGFQKYSKSKAKGQAKALKRPAAAQSKAELILAWLKAVPRTQGEIQDKGKETQEGLRRARGNPPIYI